MRERDGRTATSARLQLLASQLVEDLRDLQAGEAPARSPEERRRLETLSALAEAAHRGAFPAFQDREGRARGGRLTPDRSRLLASLDEDQEAFALVRLLRGTEEERDVVQNWARHVQVVVDQMLHSGWGALAEEDRAFVAQDLEAFLERMERLDELDERAPRSRRASLTPG